MKKIACAAAFVEAYGPIWVLAEDLKPDTNYKTADVKTPDTKEKKEKPEEKKPETKKLELMTPWDIAFGGAIMSDYLFRGITQSNHRPSLTAYFEPRYNFNDSLQGYVGLSGESITFPRTAPPPRPTSTAASGRHSVISPSILVLGITGIRTESASTTSSRIVFPA